MEHRVSGTLKKKTESTLFVEDVFTLSSIVDVWWSIFEWMVEYYCIIFHVETISVSNVATEQLDKIVISVKCWRNVDQNFRFPAHISHADYQVSLKLDRDGRSPRFLVAQRVYTRKRYWILARMSKRAIASNLYCFMDTCLLGISCLHTIIPKNFFRKLKMNLFFVISEQRAHNSPVCLTSIVRNLTRKVKNKY